MYIRVGWWSTTKQVFWGAPNRCFQHKAKTIYLWWGNHKLWVLPWRLWNDSNNRCFQHRAKTNIYDEVITSFECSSGNHEMLSSVDSNNQFFQHRAKTSIYKWWGSTSFLLYKDTTCNRCITLSAPVKCYLQ